jgi:hypothetical protein
VALFEVREGVVAMNKELIGRLGREAGLPTGAAWGFMPNIEAFAFLVAEACAKACEATRKAGNCDHFDGCDDCAAAIRALFAPPASQ